MNVRLLSDMASKGQNHYILALFLILAVWNSQVMSRTLQEASLSEKYEQWIARYGKVYKDAEEKQKRFLIFKDNLEFIESFNADRNKSYKLSINQFSDQTNEEFKATRSSYKRSQGLRTMRETSFRYKNVTDVPASVDWRRKGAVTPVKSQGLCGGSAFSSVAATEGIHQITTGKLVSLSVQEVIDCDKLTVGNGCVGGSIEDVFEFIIKNGGITSEANYPYKGVEGTCDTKKEASHVAKIKGYEKVPANNEEALLKAVAGQPVSAAIDAGESAFQFYSSGIFTGDCGTELDHDVAVVGYGVADNDIEYWIIKNSWGTQWGEQGYMRMKRNITAKEGLCGVAMDASYPTV